MKPFMKQRVVFDLPILDRLGEPKKDKYGRPKTEKVSGAANVQYKTHYIQDTDGEYRKTNLEIDIPADFNPAVGSEVTIETAAGVLKQGIIRSIEDAPNLAGNHIHYRTVTADEK